MAWRLVRPVIMAPNVRPDADGIEVIKHAVEVPQYLDPQTSRCSHILTSL